LVPAVCPLALGHGQGAELRRGPLRSSAGGGNVRRRRPIGTAKQGRTEHGARSVSEGQNKDKHPEAKDELRFKKQAAELKRQTSKKLKIREREGQGGAYNTHFYQFCLCLGVCQKRNLTASGVYRLRNDKRNFGLEPQEYL
jgi:hypothetical protein